MNHIIDYLRINGEDALQYADLKRQLAEQYRADRHGYSDAKDPFIWDVMRRADRWAQAIGWEPAACDV
jgi:GrpB-like predicted nucleotidyltransferase (UPF0157 family)